LGWKDSVTQTFDHSTKKDESDFKDLISSSDVDAVIVGVHIDTDGELAEAGIPHWITVQKDGIQYDEDGDITSVVLYNPYSNSTKEYSWSELDNSLGFGSGSGFWTVAAKK